MISHQSSGRPDRLVAPYQLLVEGDTTRDFVLRALSNLRIEKVEVHDFGGIDDLAENLRLFPKRPNFHCVRRIGVIRDAERSAKSASQAICGAFERSGFGNPPKHAGRFMKSGRKSQARFEVGYFVLGGRTGSGMLETMCLDAANDRRVMKHVETFVESATEEIGKRATDKHRCMSYLAIMKPDLRVPNAFGVLWNLDHQVFRELVAFLRELSSE